MNISEWKVEFLLGVEVLFIFVALRVFFSYLAKYMDELIKKDHK